MSTDPGTPATDQETSGLCHGGAGGIALATRWGQAYDEKAFHYFLALERKRALRARHPLRLLLVDVSGPSERRAPLAPALGRQLLSGLLQCLRGSDLVGWYREGCVVGAVLTEVGTWPWPDAARRVGQRVSATLGARVPPEVARRLRVQFDHDQATENIDPAAGAAGFRRTQCSSSA